MDPLSMTLSVISIVTAIKDALEVVDQFREAFSKVSENYEDATQLMDDIHDILDGMRIAYKEDIECSERAPSLRQSLISLKNDILRVRYECSQLLRPPSSGGGKKHLFGLTSRLSFNKNSKIKASIQELKIRVDKSLGLFMFLSNIRIEATVNSIDQKLNARLISLAQSSSIVSQNWSWESVPAQDLAPINLRRELGNLEMMLQKYSARWFENYLADPIVPPARNIWFLQLEPSSSGAMHRHALSVIMQAQNTIESLGPSWAHDTSTIMTYFAAYLALLDMNKEAIFVNNLVVDLWRAMATVYPKGAAPEHLLVSLTSLSESLLAMGYTQQSQLANDEAGIVIQSMPERKDQEAVRIVLARHYAVTSGTTKDLSTSLRLAESAVHQMETVLDTEPVASQNLESADNIGRSLKDIFNLKQIDSLHDHIYTYAVVLLRHSYIQAKSEHLPEASRNGQHALETLQPLSKFYSKSHRILNLKSTILFHLTGSKLSEMNTASQNQEYFNENAIILKLLRQIKDQRHAG